MMDELEDYTEQDIAELSKYMSVYEKETINDIMTSSMSEYDKRLYISHIFDNKYSFTQIIIDIKQGLDFIMKNKLDGEFVIIDQDKDKINVSINDYKIIKWRGVRNDESGKIENGYLYILKNDRTIGLYMRGVHNRSQAVKKYIINKSEYDIRFIDLQQRSLFINLQQ